MKAKRIILMAVIGLTLFTLAPATNANAQTCCYFNPLLLPFYVVETAVGAAATIATAPFRVVAPPPPVYYGPPRVYYGPPRAYYGPPPVPPPHHRAWIRGHHTPDGEWVPGHWR